MHVDAEGQLTGVDFPLCEFWGQIEFTRLCCKCLFPTDLFLSPSEFPLLSGMRHGVVLLRELWVDLHVYMKAFSSVH